MVHFSGRGIGFLLIFGCEMAQLDRSPGLLSQLTWSGQVSDGCIQHHPLVSRGVRGGGPSRAREAESTGGVRADRHLFQDSYPRFLKSDMYKASLAEAVIPLETKRR